MSYKHAYNHSSTYQYSMYIKCTQPSHWSKLLLLLFFNWENPFACYSFKVHLVRCWCMHDLHSKCWLCMQIREGLRGWCTWIVTAQKKIIKVIEMINLLTFNTRILKCWSQNITITLVKNVSVLGSVTGSLELISNKSNFPRHFAESLQTILNERIRCLLFPPCCSTSCLLISLKWELTGFDSILFTNWQPISSVSSWKLNRHYSWTMNLCDMSHCQNG